MIQAHREIGFCACPKCNGLTADGEPDADTIRTPLLAPSYSDDQVVAQIDSGRSWSGSTITFGFLQSAPSWDIGFEGDGFSAFTSYQASATRLALSFWDDLIAPAVVEQTSSQQYANIKFGNTTTSIAYAHAYYPGNYAWAGEIWLNSATYTQLYFPDPGDYYFMTILHEIGHALGLSHPGSYNGGSPTYANDAVYAQDTHQWTVMSYFSAGNTGADWNGGGGWQYAQTPMVHDILTVQSIYGADTSTRVNDTTYGFNATAGADVFDFSKNSSPVLTIYDAGGVDTLDLSGFSQRAIMNLQPGTYSSAGGTFSSMTYNIGIAHNTWIENAIGGSGSDVIYGNALDNTLLGGGGNDHLHGYDGNDQLKGGTGTDWVHFIDSISSYSFAVSESYIRVLGTFVDTVWSDVEWFSFADGNRTYDEIEAAFGLQVVEAEGTWSLVSESGLYQAVAGDGSEIGLSYGGDAVGFESFAGWTAIQVEAAASGGFDLLWESDSGSYSWWKTDANGVYQSNWWLTGAQLAYAESAFGVDFNGDDQISTASVIEAYGNLALALISDRYVAVAGDGSELLPTYGGNVVGPDSFGGWKAIQIEAGVSAEINVLWTSAGGSYAWWKADTNGAYETTWLLTAAQVPYTEGTFAADLNNDGQISAASLVEISGETSLALVDSQYRVVAGDGSAVLPTYLGNAVGTESFAGWQAIQVEADASGGFDLLWASDGGLYSWWKTDANGVYQSYWQMTGAQASYAEATFDVDFNQDDQISTALVVEAYGDWALALLAGEYRAVGVDGAEVGVTYGGDAVGPDSFDGWDAIQIEASALGGFELLWISDSGSYAWWKTDADGAFEQSRFLDPDELIYLEESFGSDLNKDGQVTDVSLIESDGDMLLAIVGDEYHALAIDGTKVVPTYGGQPVGPDSFGGWEAIHVEESSAGGFELLWAHEDRSYAWWKTDANGEFESSRLLAHQDLDGYESIFEADLNQDGSVGQALADGDLLLL